jgi:hypothetical protein
MWRRWRHYESSPRGAHIHQRARDNGDGGGCVLLPGQRHKFGRQCNHIQISDSTCRRHAVGQCVFLDAYA